MIPFGLITWLGLSVSQNEHEAIKNQFSRVYLTQLNEYRSLIENLKSEYEKRMDDLLNLESFETSHLRNFVRKNRLIEQVFILNPKKVLIHPKQNYQLTNRETDFLDRTSALWTNDDPFFQPRQENLKKVPQFGWYTWFWNQEARFIFWKKATGGLIVGAEINPSIILADIIALLPDTPLVNNIENKRSSKLVSQSSNVAFNDFRIVIENVKGEPLYQWGNYNPKENEQFQADLSLFAPFNMWQLTYYTSESGLEQYRDSNTLYLAITLVILCLSLFALAYYFYRENTRQIKDAGQKVTFVNQVSHELKTPLTNIRMYAELLENQSASLNEKSKSYVEVVISESQRLSRLISNVLTFANPQKYQRKLRLSHTNPGEIIQHALDSFLPAFQSKSVDVQFENNCHQEIKIDADILEQIICNLLSNIEKYGYAGAKAQIKCSITSEHIIIVVSDDGPGIPVTLRKKVFQPFYRISNQLSDGISGTGIGLTISKNLALLHGGDLTIIPSEKGVTFKLDLKIYS